MWDIPLLQVGLGADDNTRNLIHSAEVDDFVVHDLDHVERLARGDRVDEHEAVDADRMLRVEDGVFILRNEPVSFCSLRRSETEKRQKTRRVT